MTSLQKLLGYTVNMDELNEMVIEYFCSVFDFNPERTNKRIWEKDVEKGSVRGHDYG